MFVCFFFRFSQISPMSYRIPSLVLQQKYNHPSASEATLNNMGKWMNHVHALSANDICKNEFSITKICANVTGA